MIRMMHTILNQLSSLCNTVAQEVYYIIHLMTQSTFMYVFNAAALIFLLFVLSNRNDL